MHALDGLKVLDLSRVLAGPWCTQTLADLGADVWKVEEPGKGDDTRIWMPPDINGESTYFLCCNRSKRSVAINLKSEEGRAIIRRMAAEADVFIENFRTGKIEEFGLGYEDLAKINPRLVYCSISGYGRTGPRAEEAGYDFVIQAESGLMSVTGEVEGSPMKLGAPIADIVTGMHAVQAILAALIARGRTGRGQYIDMALLDCTVAMLANVGSAHLATGRTPRRFGNGHAMIVPYQTFAARDAHFLLAVGNDLQFRLLCEWVIGRPELAGDARFATNRGRVENRDVLLPILDEIFAREPAAHWLETLKQAGVPSGKVRSVPEVFASPEAEARGFSATVPDARHGTLRLPVSPLRLSDTPTRMPSAPPRVGEHTLELLQEILGVSFEEVEDWKSQGIVT